RRQVLAVPAERPRVFRAAAGRLHHAARRGGERLAREDGALQGNQGRDVSPFVPELRRAVRPRHHGIRRAAAGHPAVAAAHAGSDQRDEAAEREDRSGRAVLRPEDTERDWTRHGRDRARDAAVGRRREGSDRLLQAVRLRHQPPLRRNQENRGREVAPMDTAMLHFLAAPFVASLILTGIHAYLGVHVVERGVIFVDLSLAQIAALGATIALLMPITGGDPHAPVVYWISLAFTFYGAIGLFHYVFRQKFLAISMAPHRAEAEGISIKFWDFLFYASFGFVVTSSVAIAGVLLVFCYLIVPSVAAMLYADSIGRRLAIGWTMGTVVSALGVYLSLRLDLPTGATIVCTFGLVLIIMAAVRPMIQRHAPADMHQMNYRDRAHGR